jgi:hypothetical protein
MYKPRRFQRPIDPVIKEESHLRGRPQCLCLAWQDSPSTREATQFIPQIIDPPLLDHLLADQSTWTRWTSLIGMIALPWFSRRRSICELIFAQNATVHCGSDVVHWGKLADAIALFRSKFDELMRLPEAVGVIQTPFQ